MIIEIVLFGLGIYFYTKTTKSVDKIGTWSFWAMSVFLVIIWLGSVFGPPPPNVNALAISALFLWLLIPWGYWIDRHRTLR